MLISFTFGHHLTTPLGWRNFALSVVWPKKPQALKRGQICPNVKKIGIYLNFDSKSSVEFETSFQKKSSTVDLLSIPMIPHQQYVSLGVFFQPGLSYTHTTDILGT